MSIGKITVTQIKKAKSVTLKCDGLGVLLAGGRINIYANSVNVRYTKAPIESQPDYFFNIGNYLNANNNSGRQYSAYTWLGVNTSGLISPGYRISVTGNSSQPIKIEKK